MCSLHLGGESWNGKVSGVRFEHYRKSVKSDLRKYINNNLTIKIVNEGLATLHELQTVYSLEDAYLLAELADIKIEQKYLEIKAWERK